VLRGLSATGFDPFVGRKLLSLAKTSGLRDVSVAVEAYHLIAGQVDDRNLGLWETKLDIAMPAAARILGSQQAALALKVRFLDYLKREDTLSYSVVLPSSAENDQLRKGIAGRRWMPPAAGTASSPILGPDQRPRFRLLQRSACAASRSPRRGSS